MKSLSLGILFSFTLGLAFAGAADASVESLCNSILKRSGDTQYTCFKYKQDPKTTAYGKIELLKNGRLISLTYLGENPVPYTGDSMNYTEENGKLTFSNLSLNDKQDGWLDIKKLVVSAKTVRIEYNNGRVRSGRVSNCPEGT